VEGRGGTTTSVTARTPASSFLRRPLPTTTTNQVLDGSLGVEVVECAPLA